MSPELSVDKIIESQLPVTDLTSIWWLHALEEYLERDDNVTTAVMKRADQLFAENGIHDCWFMISDGSVSEAVPHYGHLAAVGDLGTNLETDFPTTAFRKLDYSQYITSEGVETAENGTINVIVRLPGNKKYEIGENLTLSLVEAYKRQIGKFYPEFTISYDDKGPAIEAV